MGTIQFTCETANLLDPDRISAADFVTFDGRVVPTDSVFTDGRLECLRQMPDSSKLRVMCNIGERTHVAHTTSLRETSQPYRLELELARGELARLRTFFALWTGAGLKSNTALEQQIREAHNAFREAIFSDSMPTALKALELSGAASDTLVLEYVRQRLTFRRQRQQNFPMTVGCRLIAPPKEQDQFLRAFNAVLVKTRWNELEPVDGEYHWDELDALVDWTTEHNLMCFGGPLLDLSSNCFPEWMSPWKTDLVNLESFTSDFVETVVGRYVGRIRHWEVVCGPNRGGANELSEEQRLNLIARAIEAAQQVDEQIQISIRVIQPWGEYLNHTENRLAPIQFVDTLRRSGVRLSEVNLDLRFGHKDLDSLLRDPLSISQLLDHWSLLQMPLNVMMAVPEQAPGPGTENLPSLIAWQCKIIEDVMLLCLSKERVSGFYSLNWNDLSVHDQPLLDSSDNIHPVVERIANFEQSWWQTSD